MTSSYVPIVNLPYLAINEIKLTNNATTPLTKVDLSAGICRDQSNTFDLNIGDYGNTNVATTIDATVVGANGIDTGALAASTLYYVYVLGDPITLSTTKAIISLSAPTVGPLMPFGYSAYRHVGYAITNSGSQFYAMLNSGNGNARKFTYDAPPTILTAGTSTTYAAISLGAKIAQVDFTPVHVNYAYTPATAGNTLKMQATGSTGDQSVITGQVAAVAVSDAATVMSKFATSQQKISYKVANGSDAVTLTIAGFDYFI